MIALSSIKRVHCIGVKGAGMTALAELLVKRGVRVTGSDTDEVFFTDKVLHALGIAVKEKFSPDNIPQDTELIVYSTAYTRETNPELQAAFGSGREVLSYPEALGLLTQEKMTLAVCGTHGKTTTSALLAHTLKEIGQDPSAIIGSEIANWGGNALSGEGKWLVIEADEYQNKLRFYQPFGVVLTSMDWDHPDFFRTPAEYEGVFADFLATVPRHGLVVACGDSALVKKTAENSLVTPHFYGFHPDNEFHVTDYQPIDPLSEAGRQGFLQLFSVERAGQLLGTFRLQLSGRHNATNATAVIAVIEALKLPREGVAKALEAFSGTKRRFERVGECRGALIYDDYAHHPDEVRATLRAFRELYPKRPLKVIFHPHTFSRTKALLQEFSQCFEEADRVYFLEIYGSARETQGGVSSCDLADLINRYTPGKAEFVLERSELVARLRQELESNDLLVTMGAGDVWQIAEILVRQQT